MSGLAVQRRVRVALARLYPGHPFSAAVHDTRSGCDYLFDPNTRITTASVLKIEIMAGVLLRAQRAGRGLTAGESEPASTR